MEILNKITDLKDNIFNVNYSLYTINSNELSNYLKKLYLSKGINYEEYNTDNNKIDNPPHEIYEYLNFFLLKDNDDHYLLDGYRRLLFYTPPNTTINVRVYDKKDFDNKSILKLMLYLNHFKMVGTSGGAFFNRGFALLLKSIFDLNILKYPQPLLGYLTSDKIETGYSTRDLSYYYNNPELISKRLLNEHFIDDMMFIEKLINSDKTFMVNQFLGSILYLYRTKYEKSFDIDAFIKYHNEHKLLSSLLAKFEKYGTTSGAESIKTVGSIIDIYINIFNQITNSGEVVTTFTEKEVAIKAIVNEYKKNKDYIKITKLQNTYTMEQLVIKTILEKKKDINFIGIVYPREKSGGMIDNHIIDYGIYDINAKLVISQQLFHKGEPELVLYIKHNDIEFKIGHTGYTYNGYNSKYSIVNSNNQKIEIFMKLDGYKKNDLSRLEKSRINSHITDEITFNKKDWVKYIEENKLA